MTGRVTAIEPPRETALASTNSVIPIWPADAPDGSKRMLVPLAEEGPRITQAGLAVP